MPDSAAPPRPVVTQATEAPTGTARIVHAPDATWLPLTIEAPCSARCGCRP